MLIYVYHPLLHEPERAAKEAAALEELGYDGIAMPDHLFVPDLGKGRPQPYAHVFTVLAACAVSTTRVKLATLVANVLARGPVELAHAAATLQRISGNRLELGLGAGWYREEFEAAGIAFPDGRSRIERLTETVRICQDLLSAGSARSHDGPFDVEVAQGTFLESACPPIFLGAAAPVAIRRAAELGAHVDLQPNSLTKGTLDLFLYNSYGPEDLADQIMLVRDVERSTGRTILISESPFVQVTPTVEAGAAARSALEQAIGLPRGTMDRSLGTIIGTAEEVAARLHVYAELGCHRVHVQATDGETAYRLGPFLRRLQAA